MLYPGIADDACLVVSATNQNSKKTLDYFFSGPKTSLFTVACSTAVSPKGRGELRIELCCFRFAGIDPGQTYFVGDHESDMRAAENAGCPGIRICRGGDAPQKDIGTSQQPCFATLLDAVLCICRQSIKDFADLY